MSFLFKKKPEKEKIKKTPETKKSNKPKKITKITLKTKIKDILEIENAESILKKYYVPCLTCPMGQFEMDYLELGYICKTYSIDSKGLLKELNDLLLKK